MPGILIHILPESLFTSPRNPYPHAPEYAPRNGFEEIAKSLVDAPKRGKDGAVVVAVFREIKDTLGERIGSRWKDTQEHARGIPDIINDLPSSDSKRTN
jgi:hypothetical protein